MESRRLLRLAVEARIEAWHHPVIEERDEAAGEVGTMLQEVLLGGNDDTMLPVEAELDVAPDAPSTVKVGGEASLFPMPTGERQFVRRMKDVAWAHHLTFQLE